MSRKRTLDTATLDLFAEAVALQPQAAQPVLALLRHWADVGMLRRLDVALAAWVLEQDAQATACTLVAVTMLAQMEGRGHSCLPLAQLVREPNTVLAWEAQEQPALQALWAQLPVHLNDWLAALQASPLVRVAGQHADEGQPLVLAASDSAQPLLYLRRYWDHERTVACHILQRSQAQHVALDEAAARQWLDRLFPPAAGSDCNWQKVACALALRGHFSVITGGPGTGKTYTAARLLALLFATAPQADQLRVALAAPTGKAAARLKQSIETALQGLKASVGAALDLPALVSRVGAARTLHSLLGARPGTRHWGHHAGRPLDVDVLIVDEASMVNLEMMSALLEALPSTARLILLGDKDQLASVEAGAVLGDLCRDAAAGRYGADTVDFVARVAGEQIPAPFHAQGAVPALAQHTVMLRASRRFEGPIAALATAVNAGDAAASVRVLRTDMAAHADDARVALREDGRLPAVHALAWQGRGTAPGYTAYAQALQQWGTVKASADLAAAHPVWVRAVLQAFDRFRLLCAVREGQWGVAGLNQAVVATLRTQGVIAADSEWYAGRPVMVMRNDAALGVFNGDIGMALPSAAPGHGLRVYFLQGDALHAVSVARLAHVETAFAMTVHKSQGSEFEHTALVLSAQAGGVLGRELVYTGITRARSHFTLMAERPGLLAAAIDTPTRRASGLLRFLEGALIG
jgi:exodeoxyribonuclease V alpha subunit